MRQFTLPIEDKSSYDPEDFIISDSNREAYSKISGDLSDWGRSPYRFSLLLEGPKSCGKTYLSRIWGKRSGALFLDIDSPIDNSLFDSFESFVLEDIDKIHDEKKALAFFNLINEKKKYLLLTGTKGRLNLKLPDLSSRINSLYKIEVEEPDDELAKILLFKQFSSDSLKVDEKVVDFLLPRLPREIDVIISTAKKINKFSLEYKKNVTIPFIKTLSEKDLSFKQDGRLILN